mmetsp:Transcript_9420/g.39566  ORF Transcript_9420/g.39566 Transcript_9420/m.39566 type:complete len:260 (-) Transcript_9420:1307-2086(-)
MTLHRRSHRQKSLSLSLSRRRKRNRRQKRPPASRRPPRWTLARSATRSARLRRRSSRCGRRSATRRAPWRLRPASPPRAARTPPRAPGTWARITRSWAASISRVSCPRWRRASRSRRRSRAPRATPNAKAPRAATPPRPRPAAFLRRAGTRSARAWVRARVLEAAVAPELRAPSRSFPRAPPFRWTTSGSRSAWRASRARRSGWRARRTAPALAAAPARRGVYRRRRRRRRPIARRSPLDDRTRLWRTCGTSPTNTGRS